MGVGLEGKMDFRVGGDSERLPEWLGSSRVGTKVGDRQAGVQNKA